MLSLGLLIQNINITNNNIINTLVASFQHRVEDDGGTFGAASCLTDVLIELNDINL